MAKIGRNDICPCRSGKKYKHCCARNEEKKVQQQPVQVTLMNGVREIQADAGKKTEMCRELGVFFFYSTALGDAWLLETTECDCLQVAQGGEALEAPIDENSDVIEINYSHTFAVVDKRLEITAYSDKRKQILADAPTRELSAAMRRIRKKISSDQLPKVHLPNPPEHAST